MLNLIYVELRKYFPMKGKYKRVPQKIFPEEEIYNG